MLSKELEFTLNLAFKEAREKNHEFMTVEHLLYALLGNPSAVEVLRACGGDLDQLKQEVGKFLEETTPKLSDEDDRETQPTLGFQRVLQVLVCVRRRLRQFLPFSRQCLAARPACQEILLFPLSIAAHQPGVSDQFLRLRFLRSCGTKWVTTNFSTYG